MQHESVQVVEKAGIELPLDFAARELSRYLSAITGRNHPVVHGKRRNSRAAVLLTLEPGLEEDEYRIRRVGPNVEISGGSPRGCLFGAYGFLQALGCRWPLPGRDFEVVPRQTKIRWSGPELRSRPAVRHRGLMWVGGEAYGDDLLDLVDYLAKNGFNFVTLHGGSPPSDFLARFCEEVRARDLGVEWGGHTLASFLPRIEFEKHPEYFRMEGGKRTARLNMCPSSPEAAELIAGNAAAEYRLLQTLPRLELLHMWPDDLVAGGWCECPHCVGLSASDQALKILNAVAERVPLGRTALAHLSYHATIDRPRQVKPHPSIRLFYAPRERCYRHAMGECKTNQRYLAWLTSQADWFPNQPEVMEYYQDLVLFRQMPVPLHPVIGRDVKVYHEAGIDRITSLCFQRYSDWAYGVNYYVLGKALWRGEGSPRDIEEYCQAMYGSGAGSMERYFDRLFELGATAMETCGYECMADLRSPPDEPFTATHAAHLSPLVAKDRLDEMEDLLAEADSTAREPHRSRIRQQGILWKVSRQETLALFKTLTAMLRMKEFRAGGMNAEDLEKTASLIHEIMAAIGDVTEILLSAPASLRGPHIFRGEGGVINERIGYYMEKPKAWLEELGEGGVP